MSMYKRSKPNTQGQSQYLTSQPTATSTTSTKTRQQPHDNAQLSSFPREQSQLAFTLDSNTQRPNLGSHEDVNAYLTGTAPKGGYHSHDERFMPADEFDIYDHNHISGAQHTSPSRVRQHPDGSFDPFPSHLASINSKSKNHFDSGSHEEYIPDFDYIPDDYGDVQPPSLDEDEYNRNVHRNHQQSQPQEDDYEPEDLEMMSSNNRAPVNRPNHTTATNTTSTNVQSAQASSNDDSKCDPKKKLTMAELDEKRQELTRRNTPLRLAPRGTGLSFKPASIQREVAETKHKDNSKKSSKDKHEQKTGSKSSKTNETTQPQHDDDDFGLDRIFNRDKHKSNHVVLTTNGAFYQKTPQPTTLETPTSKKVLSDPNTTKSSATVDQGISSFTKSALLSPFVPGSSKTTLLKTPFQTIARHTAVSQHLAAQARLPTSLRYRYGEELLSLGGIENAGTPGQGSKQQSVQAQYAIMDSYAENEPYKQYLLHGTVFRRNYGIGETLSVGVAKNHFEWDQLPSFHKFGAGEDHGEDDAEMAYSRSKTRSESLVSSGPSVLKPCFLIVESVEQESLRIKACQRIMQLNQTVLMMNTDLDRYLDQSDSYNDATHSYTIDLDTYNRLVKNLSIGNRKAILAKIEAKTQEKAKQSTTQQFQQFASFLTLLRNQHTTNIKHAVAIKMSEEHLALMDKRQAIEIELFFRFLLAFGLDESEHQNESLAELLNDNPSSLSTGQATSHSSRSTLLTDPNNAEIIYNNTIVEYIRELLFVDDKRKKVGSPLNSRINAAQKKSLKASLVNYNGDGDDSDHDEAPSKAKLKIPKPLAHQLFVDKYAPKSYSQLLSPERYNKEVLLWLSKYNYLAFKKPVPQMTVPQYQRYRENNTNSNNTSGQQTGSTPNSGTATAPTTGLSRYQLTQAMQHDFTTKFGPQQQQKILLLAGPPGSGKTTMIRVLLEMLNYRKIEVNASDDRSFDVVSHLIYNAIESNSVFDQAAVLVRSQTNPGNVTAPRPVANCVVMEEIDGAIGSNGSYDSESAPTSVIQVLVKIAQEAIAYDKAQIALLLDTNNNDDDDSSSKKTQDNDGDDDEGAKSNKKKDQKKEEVKKTFPPGRQLSRPIIATCNFLQASCLKPLLPYCKIIELPNIEKSALLNRLNQVVQIEDIPADQSFLKGLVDLLGTDVRSCLHALQFSSVELAPDGSIDLASQKAMSTSQTNPITTLHPDLNPPHNDVLNHFIHGLIQPWDNSEQDRARIKNLLAQSRVGTKTLTGNDLVSLRIGQHDSPSSIQDLTQLVLTLQDVNPQRIQNDWLGPVQGGHGGSSATIASYDIPYLRNKYHISPPIPQLRTDNKRVTEIEPPKNPITSQKSKSVSRIMYTGRENAQRAQLAAIVGDDTTANVTSLLDKDNPGYLLDQKVSKFNLSQSKLSLQHLLGSNLDTLCTLMTEYDSVPRIMEQIFFLHPLFTGYSPDIGRSAFCSDLCSFFEAASGKNGHFGGAGGSSHGGSTLGQALATLPVLISYHVNTFVANSLTAMTSATQGKNYQKDQNQQQQQQQHLIPASNSNKLAGYLPISIHDLHNDPATSVRISYSNVLGTAQYFQSKEWEQSQHNINLNFFIQRYVKSVGQYISRRESIAMIPFIYDLLIVWPAISHYPLVGYQESDAPEHTQSYQDTISVAVSASKMGDDSDEEDQIGFPSKPASLNASTTTSTTSVTTSQTAITLTTSSQIVKSGTWQDLKSNDQEQDFLHNHTVLLMKKLSLMYEPTSIYLQNSFLTNNDQATMRSLGLMGPVNGFVLRQTNLMPHLLPMVYFDFSLVLKAFRMHDIMFNPYGGPMAQAERAMACKLLSFPALALSPGHNTNLALLRTILSRRHGAGSGVLHNRGPQSKTRDLSKVANLGVNISLNLTENAVLIGDIYLAAQKSAQQQSHHFSNSSYNQLQPLPFGFNNNIKHALNTAVNLAIAQEEEETRLRVMQEQKRISAEKRAQELQKQTVHDSDAMTFADLPEQYQLTPEDYELIEQNLLLTDDNDQPLSSAEINKQRAQCIKDLESQRLKKWQQDQTDQRNHLESENYIKNLDNQYATASGANVTIDPNTISTKVKQNTGRLSFLPKNPEPSTSTLVDPFADEPSNPIDAVQPKRANVAASRADHTLQLFFTDGFSDAVKKHPKMRSFFA